MEGRYIRIASKFWTDEKIIELDTESKLLYLYILTCPHSNMAGYYRLPKEYIMADLKLLPEGLHKPFTKLLQEGLIKYCEKSSVILIPNYYKYNPIQNKNQAKGAAKKTCELPRNSLVEDYEKAVNAYAASYAELLLKGLPKPFDKQLPERLPNTETETETETEYRNSNNIYSPATQDDVSEKIPYKEIIDYLNMRTGSQYRHTTKKTRELIRARWNEGFRLEDFKTVIDKKCVEWIGTEWEKFLRPETLFRAGKFESYLNQPVHHKTSKEEKVDDVMSELFWKFKEEEENEKK
jgi:uncharacterized phage protein (TIGR02220 family)